jgi:predicted site-specific integrase-resolvase
MSLITTLFLLEQYGPRLSMEQLAKVLGLAATTLHARIGRGELDIPTYVDGKLRWADARDVAEYLDRKRQEAHDALHAH